MALFFIAALLSTAQATLTVSIAEHGRNGAGLTGTLTVNNGKDITFVHDASSCKLGGSCGFSAGKIEIYENPSSFVNMWTIRDHNCETDRMGAKVETVSISDGSFAVVLKASKNVNHLNSVAFYDSNGGIRACGTVVDSTATYEMINFQGLQNNAAAKMAIVYAESPTAKLVAVQVMPESLTTVDFQTYTNELCGEKDDSGQTQYDKKYPVAAGEKWTRIDLTASNQRSFTVLGSCVIRQLFSQSSVGNPRRLAPIVDVVGGTDGVTATLSQKSPFHTTAVTLKYDPATDPATESIGGYHVHKYPVGAKNTNCGGDYTSGHFNPYGVTKTNGNYAGKAPRDIEVGDLSAKHGSLSGVSSAQTISYTDFDLPLLGINTVAGRSIVFHAASGGARKFCFNLTHAETLKNKDSEILKNQIWNLSLDGTKDNSTSTNKTVAVTVRQNSLVNPRGGTFVTFRALPNLATSTGHKAAIVQGKCDALGSALLELGNLEFKADSVSTVHATSFDVSMKGFRDKESSAVVYGKDASSDVLLCAKVSAANLVASFSVFCVLLMQVL